MLICELHMEERWKNTINTTTTLRIVFCLQYSIVAYRCELNSNLNITYSTSPLQQWPTHGAKYVSQSFFFQINWNIYGPCVYNGIDRDESLLFLIFCLYRIIVFLWFFASPHFRQAHTVILFLLVKIIRFDIYYFYFLFYEHGRAAM